jgi:hypothetical protein
VFSIKGKKRKLVGQLGAKQSIEAVLLKISGFLQRPGRVAHHRDPGRHAFCHHSARAQCHRMLHAATAGELLIKLAAFGAPPVIDLVGQQHIGFFLGQGTKVVFDMANDLSISYLLLI